MVYNANIGNKNFPIGMDISVEQVILFSSKGSCYLWN